MNLDDAVSELADAGLLTERQAEIYVLRGVEGVPRDVVADDLGISVNTVDNHLARARELVEQAESTASTVETVRYIESHLSLEGYE